MTETKKDARAGVIALLVTAVIFFALGALVGCSPQSSPGITAPPLLVRGTATLDVCSNGKAKETVLRAQWSFENPIPAGAFLDVDFFYLSSAGVYTYFHSVNVQAPSATGSVETRTTVAENLLGRKVVAKLSLVDRNASQGIAALETGYSIPGFC